MNGVRDVATVSDPVAALHSLTLDNIYSDMDGAWKTTNSAISNMIAFIHRSLQSVAPPARDEAADIRLTHRVFTKVRTAHSIMSEM